MEYKMKCNVCGKVFCYTDEDLQKNVSNAGLGALSALGSLASTLGGGTIFHTHHLQGQADRYSDKIVDYNQCPYCHSRSLSVFAGNTEETKVVKTVNINTSASTESLLKRVFIFLEDGEWETADAYCEACLDKDPESGKAYLGKLMAELHVKIQEELKNQQKPFDSNANYRKAIRYADDELKNTLIGYTKYINNRNENTRKDKVLRDAKAKIAGNTIADYEDALSLIASIPGWEDADEQKSICLSKIAELKAKEEADRLEREHLAEIERKKAEEEAEAAKARAKKNKKIAAIVVPILVVLIVAVVVISNSVEKSNAYENALALLDAGQYAEAIEAFTALDGYKDSVEKIEYAEQEKAYSEAVSLLANKKFSEAIIAFESMDGYRDSIQQVYESKYLWALHCLEVSEDRNAYELLTELADLGYKESSTYLADFIYLPSAVTIADGKKILCDYDLHGNVICGLIKMKPDYSVLVLDTSYAFPNETFMSYPVFDSIEYTYNEDGSFIRQYGFSVTSSTSIEYMDSFDAKGQCISRYRYFDSDDYGSSSEEYIFEYYDNGRYRKLSHLSDGEISWVREYEEDGTFTSTSYRFPSLNDNEKDTTDEYNNITCGDNNYQYTYDYDENGNLVHREVYQGNTKVMYTNYFYDEYGYLIRQEGTKRNGREYSDEFSYEYGYFYCPEAVE